MSRQPRPSRRAQSVYCRTHPLRRMWTLTLMAVSRAVAVRCEPP
jgi:hypothetical protein